MTIDQVEESLPNGLHDAVMHKHEVDYVNKILTFYLDVWIGDLDSNNEEEREKYQSGILTFKGVEYFIIEPSEGGVSVVFEPFSFSAGNPEIDEIKPSVELPSQPSDTTRTYLFIYKLNAFMHICSKDVDFTFVK